MTSPNIVNSPYGEGDAKLWGDPIISTAVVREQNCCQKRHFTVSSKDGLKNYGTSSARESIFPLVHLATQQDIL